MLITCPQHAHRMPIACPSCSLHAHHTPSFRYAFQLSGSTAGVMVCFCLPGFLFYRANRLTQNARIADLQQPFLSVKTANGLSLGPGSLPAWLAHRAWLPCESWDELAGLAMLAAGAFSGTICLAVLLRG